MLEFQQNLDVTYRLYDYGRPRELHLDDAINVVTAAAFPDELVQHVLPAEQRVLVDGPHFTLLQTHEDVLQDRLRWVLPLGGAVRCGNEVAGAGDCLLLAPGQELDSSGARMLIGATAARS